MHVKEKSNLAVVTQKASFIISSFNEFLSGDGSRQKIVQKDFSLAFNALYKKHM